MLRQRSARYALIASLAAGLLSTVVLTGAAASGAHAAGHAAAGAAPGPAGNTLRVTEELRTGRMTVWVRYRYRGRSGIEVRAVRASFAGRTRPDTPWFVFGFRHPGSGAAGTSLRSRRDNANHVTSFRTGWIRPRGGRALFSAGETLMVTLWAENGNGDLYHVMQSGLILTPAVP